MIAAPAAGRGGGHRRRRARDRRGSPARRGPRVRDPRRSRRECRPTRGRRRADRVPPPAGSPARARGAAARGCRRRSDAPARLRPPPERSRQRRDEPAEAVAEEGGGERRQVVDRGGGFGPPRLDPRRERLTEAVLAARRLQRAKLDTQGGEPVAQAPEGGGAAAGVGEGDDPRPRAGSGRCNDRAAGRISPTRPPVRAPGRDPASWSQRPRRGPDREDRLRGCADAG